MALPDLAVWHLLSPGAAAAALMSGFGFLMAPSYQSCCKGVTVAVLIY